MEVDIQRRKRCRGQNSRALLRTNLQCGPIIYIDMQLNVVGMAAEPLLITPAAGTF